MIAKLEVEANYLINSKNDIQILYMLHSWVTDQNIQNTVLINNYKNRLAFWNFKAILWVAQKICFGMLIMSFFFPQKRVDIFFLASPTRDCGG